MQKSLAVRVLIMSLANVSLANATSNITNNATNTSGNVSNESHHGETGTILFLFVSFGAGGNY